MLIQIHASGFKLNGALRHLFEEKIVSSLTRFANRIGKVDAYLVDVNGPKGGIDKLVRLVVEVSRKPTIVIEEKGEQWIELLDSVTERGEQTVGRQIRKSYSRTDRTSMSGDGGSLNRPGRVLSDLP